MLAAAVPTGFVCSSTAMPTAHTSISAHRGASIRSPDFGVEIWASQIGWALEDWLLVVAHGQFGGERFEVAKEATCAMIGAGREIELGGR